MDKAVVKRTPSGVSPTSVAASVAPVLVLLGFNAQSSTLNIPVIVLTQLVTILLVQLLSIYTRVSSSSLRQAITVGPVKVELIQDKPTLASSITEAAGHATESALRVATPAESTSPSIATVANDIKPAVQPDILESTITEGQVLEPRFPAARGIAIPEHTLYPNTLIDDTLRKFLALVDADQLKYLTGASSDATAEQTESVPLASWPTMLTTPSSQVAKHPTIPHLYSIRASYPDIPLRSLWELLIDIKQRPNWDSMCYATEEIDAIGNQDQTGGATRQADITYLATKGMFPVKATDMVMLSVNAQMLPTTRQRLVCATTTVEHPDKPVYRSYTRMSLTISGFMAEDDGHGGCTVTQLTDLSALGSWVPSRMIKLVTESMIPRSLVRIGEAAKQHILTGPRSMLTGDAWLPPVIGSWDVPSSPTSSVTLVDANPAASINGADDAIESIPTSASDLDDMPASSSRELRELVTQLRAVNSRLSSLEKAAGASSDGPATSQPLPIGNTHRPVNMGLGLAPTASDKALLVAPPSGPLGWLSRAASSMSMRGFLSGVGAGIFSTTTAATVAAFAVYYFRKQLR